MTHCAKTFVVAALLLSFCGAAFAEEPDPRESLDTAIPYAIRLLEMKDGVAFVKAFMPPGDLEKITSAMTIEEFAGKLPERRVTALIEALKQIKDAEPKRSEDGTQVTYELKDSPIGKDTMVFTKIGKYWYLSN